MQPDGSVCDFCVRPVAVLDVCITVDLLEKVQMLLSVLAAADIDIKQAWHDDGLKTGSSEGAMTPAFRCLDSAPVVGLEETNSNSRNSLVEPVRGTPPKFSNSGALSDDNNKFIFSRARLIAM